LDAGGAGEREALDAIDVGIHHSHDYGDGRTVVADVDDGLVRWVLLVREVVWAVVVKTIISPRFPMQ
jgi:hypothetical protein